MTHAVLSYQFIYDGASRIVDNVDLTPGSKTIVGFEMRKSGQFSYKVKRYKLEKIQNLRLIDPVHRVGPKIGRPGEPGK